MSPIAFGIDDDKRDDQSFRLGAEIRQPIAELVQCDRADIRAEGEPCAAVDDIAHTQLAATRARISRLNALETELERMLEQCSCGAVQNCRVIEVLGGHAHCAHEHHFGEAT